MGDVSPSRRMLHSPPVAIDGQIATAAMKGEIWEKWGATYGRNGCVGEKKNEPRIREELLG